MCKQCKNIRKYKSVVNALTEKPFHAVVHCRKCNRKFTLRNKVTWILLTRPAGVTKRLAVATYREKQKEQAEFAMAATMPG